MGRLLLAPEQGALDHIDLLRHVLGNLVLPHTVNDMERVLVRMGKAGTQAPSGLAHTAFADVKSVLDELTGAGYAKVFSGHPNHASINAATQADKAVIDHPAPQDTPHAEERTVQVPRDDGTVETLTFKPHVQTLNRGEIWAELADSPAEAEHWIMTKLGFEALTGHPQGGGA